MQGLPTDYVAQYVYQYVGYVKEKKNGCLNGGCPICHEGDSWQKKARFHYNPNLEGERNTCSCFNCGYNSNSVNFIMTISGMSFKEVMEESKNYDIIPRDINYDEFERQFEVKKNEYDLPKNSIDLFDKNQLNYYKDNPIVRLAIKYLVERKINKAPNRPKTFYLSLDDFVHKNRLIIPYYDNNKVVWYQSRKLLDDDSQKYLSKADSERSFYNLDEIDDDIPYLFIFEGAIDSMFVKNGTCLSGITEKGEFTLTEHQKNQLTMFPFHEKIWIMDSPYLDDAARKKTSMLFHKGEKVFQWPENIGKQCKDFNDIIMKSTKTNIPQEFILRNIMEVEPNYMKLDIGSLRDNLNINLQRLNH